MEVELQRRILPDINMYRTSIFQQNHASGSGGAVYLDAGTLSFDGCLGYER